jgi:AraC-like DNA-binding protein
VYPEDDSSEQQAQLFRLYGGDIFITRPGEYHSTGPFQQQRGKLYWFHLDSACTDLLLQTPQTSELLKKSLAELNHHVLRVPLYIRSRLTEAFQLLMRGDENRLLRACQLLSLFILELAEWSRSVSSETFSALSLEAISYIQNNLFQPNLSVERISAHLHYGRTYVMTTFHKEVGMTIHEFILREKVEAARDLLLEYSVTETALLLHFSSSQHFARVFKEHTGRTPREYAMEPDIS